MYTSLLQNVNTDIAKDLTPLKEEQTRGFTRREEKGERAQLQSLK